jgi:hypothetical protein
MENLRSHFVKNVEKIGGTRKLDSVYRVLVSFQYTIAAFYPSFVFPIQVPDARSFSVI